MLMDADLDAKKKVLDAIMQAASGKSVDDVKSKLAATKGAVAPGDAGDDAQEDDGDSVKDAGEDASDGALAMKKDDVSKPGDEEMKLASEGDDDADAGSEPDADEDDDMPAIVKLLRGGKKGV